jgi:hypothetical protein
MKVYKSSYQGLPTNGLHKAIDNLRYELSSYFGTPHNRWVTIHASFPFATLLNHGWYGIRGTEVISVLQCAYGYFLNDF